MTHSETQSNVPQSGPWFHFHRRLYDWVVGFADTRYALPALFGISFIESSFFPIPPDVLLMALVLGCPKKWWHYAFWCTVASVLGGVFGYGIGVFAWETVGLWIVQHIAHVTPVVIDGRLDVALPTYIVNHFAESLGGKYLFQVYDVWNAWIVFIFGLTPLPYKLITISAGVARVDLGIFVLASVVSRAARFYAVSYILFRVGPRAKTYIEKNFNLVTILFVLLLIGGFAAVKLVLN